MIVADLKLFDPELHIYRSKGIRLPGATDIIKAAGLIDTEWMTDEARWRGKCVHKGVELINKNRIDWETVDEFIAGYLHSYRKFISTTGFEIVGCEEPCFDDAFACMPDIWGYLNKVPTIIELKSGPVKSWVAIQTALQQKALYEDKKFMAENRFGLRLMADGSISKLIPFQDRSDGYYALSMVETFHWKIQHGYIKKWRMK